MSIQKSPLLAQRAFLKGIRKKREKTPREKIQVAAPAIFLIAVYQPLLNRK